MKRLARYAASGMKSALFLAAFGCLLVAALTSAAFRPASAARCGAQSIAAPQNYAPQFQELKAASHAPAAEAQDYLRGEPLEGGSVLELRGGQTFCRPATEVEARAMQRRPDQQLRVIGDEAFAPEQAQQGLKIVLRGTPQLEQFPEAKAAFLRAARAWESLIQNPITVVIDVDFGPTDFGKPFREYQYGATRFQRIAVANVYPTIRSALIQSAGSPQEAALYNALPPAQLPTDLGATRGMIYHSATLRALGLLPPVANPDAEMKDWRLPPGIAFNSNETFDFDPSDGIRPKRLDFNAAAIHEIGHALGFFSSVGLNELHPEILVTPEVLDLFRFRPGVTFETFATAPRIQSSGGAHVLFGGGAELPLSTGRQDYTGGDGEQAGHWKDDVFTGRYIGIMDPSFIGGRRYEMTANDIEAFELIGYRMNPLPNPREAELKPDDGAMDTGALRDGAIIVNRLTPPAYPATLRKLRIVIPFFQDRPDPAGKPITLLIGASSDSNSEPPPGAQFTRIETTVPSGDAELFLEFPIPDGPTISSGDFYVGYQTPTPHQSVGFAVDFSGLAPNRSFYSFNNGVSFAPLSQAYQGRAANAMIRALVSVPGPDPTPTPTPAPTPTPTTVALTSGVPQDGYMPRSEPTGAAFEIQYTIEVPSGATQLKVDLNANTDLDLYARFGSLVVIQNGLPRADFYSASDDYHESITITPGSSPALKAGVYYLMVMNYGPGPSTFKITATVTGGSPPGNRAVRAGPTSGSPGGQVSVPIELVAQGDENALGFSLSFDPAVLGNPQAALGSDTASATLNTNTSRLGQGRLGIALSLPTGQKFNAGARQIVVVNFTIASNVTASSTPIGFGDQPITREISGTNANTLPASYTPGSITISSGIEGDVAPRPNGNGSVTITDWVQIGRFVAGQDTPSGSEFQRADTAPRETRGNGALTVTDWVQAGRYAAGIDPVTSAGGPATSGSMARAQFVARGNASARQVRLFEGPPERGQRRTVIIALDAEGDESALGFSLDFDLAQLQFVSATLGEGASGATLNVNTNEAARGQLGLALAMPAGQTIAAGLRRIVVLTFAAAPGVSATATIGFGDLPVRREVSDVNARALPVSFVVGKASLNRKPPNVLATGSK